jgi:hypothetical protein
MINGINIGGLLDEWMLTDNNDELMDYGWMINKRVLLNWIEIKRCSEDY